MNDIITKPILSQEALDRFIKFEGKVPHFYLDGPGNVTIGIGCLLANASSASVLSMVSKHANYIVVPTTIINEFNLIRRALAGQSIKYYDSITHLYLPDSAILSLFYFRVQDTIEQLQKHIPEWPTLPEAVHEVLLDMAFNLGLGGFWTKFPKFVDAIRNRNFIKAAEESHRLGIQEERNVWTKETLTGAANG